MRKKYEKNNYWRFLISNRYKIWELAIIVFAENNLVSSWATPPERFLTTISETGMALPMVKASILLLLGLVIMGIEYFRKDK